jgi:sodium-dependent dicarboxylate transporter 2/3/5
MYLSDQVLILFGSCMLATAVEEYDLHRRLALAILRRTGDSPYRLVLGTATPTHY